MPFASTTVTATLSVALTVTRISSPVFVMVVFRVTLLITGAVVSRSVILYSKPPAFTSD